MLRGTRTMMRTRREFCVQLALAAAGARAFAQSSASVPAEAMVDTPLGTLRGESVNGVRVYRGVPFAIPPVDDLRFRAPQPVQPWGGVREATKFAAAAMQPGEKNIPQSEDCLYLNVWAPESGGPYPVFVWIHGGGFTGGHAFDRLFDGTEFARAGIVCVTVSYRLGVLGFLDVSPVLGPSYVGSADNALRDLVASLQWVQANVGAFGGDPKRVTVGGESAGAKLTDLLMGCPQAAPLFQQMISESGGAERIFTEDRARTVGQDFGKLWSEQTTLAATAIREAPARQLIDVQERFTATYPVHFPLRAELHSSMFPRAPITTIRIGNTKGKRLLLGTNRDESALFLGPHPEKAPGAGDLGNLSVAQFEKVARRYQRIYPEMSAEQRRIRSVTAEEYWIPSLRVADAHMAGGGQAFVYRLDFPGEGRFAGLAFHSYDLRFVWNYFGTEVPAAASSKLAADVHAAWVSFIKTGTPAAPGLPAWPVYSAGERPTMLLDANPRVENAPGRTEFALWNGLIT